MAISILLILLEGCTKTEPSAIQKESFIKSFGGAYGNDAVDMIKDNGFYYILGNTKDEKDSTQIFLAKTDEFGNRVWPRDLTFTKNSKQTQAGQIIKLEKQAGFAIIGSIETDNDSLYYDSYLLIIDENGAVLSETIYYNDSVNDYGKCIGETQNGGFTIAALSAPANGSLSYIDFISAASNGELILRASPIIATELFNMCKKSNNEGFYVTAYAPAIEQNPKHSMVIILNADGKPSAPPNFGSILGQIRGIVQDKSSNTFVCGRLDSGENGGNDGFIAKLTNVDEGIGVDWLYEYGKTGTDYLGQLVVTENNEILLTGSTEDIRLKTNDIWVLKTDIAGNKLSETIIGGDRNEYGVHILESENNRYIVEGTTYFENNSLISIFKSELK